MKKLTGLGLWQKRDPKNQNIAQFLPWWALLEIFECIGSYELCISPEHDGYDLTGSFDASDLPDNIDDNPLYSLVNCLAPTEELRAHNINYIIIKVDINVYFQVMILHGPKSTLQVMPTECLTDSDDKSNFHALMELVLGKAENNSWQKELKLMMNQVDISVLSPKNR